MSDNPLYYVKCPRCRDSLGPPFNRLGGPQYYEHRCGDGHRPRMARFLVAASGTGYVSYELDKGERAEAVYVRMIDYWEREIRETIPLTRNGASGKLDVA
ncbi:MAG: hypothetical protein GWN53_17245 [Gammaproteobacteria bacterium]|nr:hypothetical protein [Gammaproteobacteria bacterium]